MINTNIQNKDRAYFFDNIRYLIVLLVVVLHMGDAYSNYVPWWPVNDQNSRFFDFLLSIIDIFIMPTLFFIAGYFALQSIRKTNCLSFIKNKVIRLGIPWLIGIVLMQPILSFVYYYSRGFDDIDIWGGFIRAMKSALTFNTGYITSPVQFNHYHLWFISLLLLFCIIFALAYKGKQILTKYSESTIKTNVSSNKRILLSFLMATIISAILTSIIFKVLYSPINPTGVFGWVIVGSVIQFQTIRIGLYCVCFIFGIYASHKQWFTNGSAPVHPIVWLILSIILYVVYVVMFRKIMHEFSMTLGITMVFVRIFLVFSSMLALISFGIKYWNSSSKINRSLASNSYNIYLFHLVFVYLIQLLLLKCGISIYSKFIIGCVFSIVVSYLFSRFIVKPIVGIGRNKVVDG